MVNHLKSGRRELSGQFFFSFGQKKVFWQVRNEWTTFWVESTRFFSQQKATLEKMHCLQSLATCGLSPHSLENATVSEDNIRRQFRQSWSTHLIRAYQLCLSSINLERTAPANTNVKSGLCFLVTKHFGEGGRDLFEICVKEAFCSETFTWHFLELRTAQAWF